MEFKQKRNLKKILYSRFIVVVLVIILFFLLRGLFGVYEKAKVAYVGGVNSKKILRDLKIREASLAAGIKKLKSERGVEDEIREKFGVVKEGEQLVVILNKSENKNKNESEGNVGSFWNRLISLFEWK